VTRITSSPRWLFMRLAVLVTLVLWLPDVWILLKHEPARAVGVLMAMHLGIALVTYNLLVRVAPARESRGDRSEHESAPPAELLQAGEEDPARASPRTAGRSVLWLATTLSALVGVDFALGMVALFSVPAGRPSGWLPGKGTAIYLAHAIVGLPLALGAVAFLVLVRDTGRSLKVTGWMGLIGVAVAGVGGAITDLHPLRLLGMALMFVGPMFAGFVYLTPLVDSMPAEAPPEP
jgi:hypothetical protein